MTGKKPNLPLPGAKPVKPPPPLPRALATKPLLSEPPLELDATDLQPVKPPLELDATDLQPVKRPPPLPARSAQVLDIPIDIGQSILPAPIASPPNDAPALFDIDIFAPKGGALSPPPLPKMGVFAVPAQKTSADDTGIALTSSTLLAAPSQPRLAPQQRKWIVAGAAAAVISVGIFMALHGRGASGATTGQASTPTQVDPTRPPLAETAAPQAPEPTAEEIIDPTGQKPPANTHPLQQPIDVSTKRAAAAPPNPTPTSTPNPTSNPSPTKLMAPQPAAIAERTTPPPRAAAVNEPQAPPPTPAPVKAAAQPSNSFDVDTAPPFDQSVAMQALRQAGDQAYSCRSLGVQDGSERINVTFAHDGSVSSVTIDGPASGTPAGKCMIGRFRSLRVPVFRGSSMTVHKTLNF